MLLNLCAWVTLGTIELRMLPRPLLQGLDPEMVRTRRILDSSPDKFVFHSLPVLLSITLHAKLLLFP